MPFFGEFILTSAAKAPIPQEIWWVQRACKRQPPVWTKGSKKTKKTRQKEENVSAKSNKQERMRTKCWRKNKKNRAQKAGKKQEEPRTKGWTKRSEHADMKLEKQKKKTWTKWTKCWKKQEEVRRKDGKKNSEHVDIKLEKTKEERGQKASKTWRNNVDKDGKNKEKIICINKKRGQSVDTPGVPPTSWKPLWMAHQFLPGFSNWWDALLTNFTSRTFVGSVPWHSSMTIEAAKISQPTSTSLTMNSPAQAAKRDFSFATLPFSTCFTLRLQALKLAAGSWCTKFLWIVQLRSMPLQLDLSFRLPHLCHWCSDGRRCQSSPVPTSREGRYQPAAASSAKEAQQHCGTWPHFSDFLVAIPSRFPPSVIQELRGIVSEVWFAHVNQPLHISVSTASRPTNVPQKKGMVLNLVVEGTQAMCETSTAAHLKRD